MSPQASFWMPAALSDCRPAVANFQCLHTQNRYYCEEPHGGAWIAPDPSRASCAPSPYNCTDAARYERGRCAGGQFSTYATLSMTASEDAILAFFHSPARAARTAELLISDGSAASRPDSFLAIRSRRIGG